MRSPDQTANRPESAGIVDHFMFRLSAPIRYKLVAAAAEARISGISNDQAGNPR
jgi:hypothetical protein